MIKENSVLIQMNKIIDIRKFAAIVTKYESDINIYNGSSAYDAKSIMAIFALDTSQPRYVEILSNDQEEINTFIMQMEPFMVSR